MKETIKLIEGYGIEKAKESIKKFDDMPDNMVPKYVIEMEKKKIEEFEHAIEILKNIDSFLESFSNIK